MHTWDACEQSWKNGYEKGTNDMARYVANWLSVSNSSLMNENALYEYIIKEFKTHMEEKND